MRSCCGGDQPRVIERVEMYANVCVCVSRANCTLALECWFGGIVECIAVCQICKCIPTHIYSIRFAMHGKRTTVYACLPVSMNNEVLLATTATAFIGIIITSMTEH